jgi:hypothetical protein
MASADLVVAAVASSGAEDMALRRPQARRISGAWDAIIKPSIVALCALNTRHRAESGGGTKSSSCNSMDVTSASRIHAANGRRNTLAYPR